MKRISIVAWISISLACFVSVASAEEPACKHSPFWAEFHKENMERWNQCETVLNVHNVGRLGLKWRYGTGSGVVSSPTVANGVVYIGSRDGNVYALKAGTYGKLWSYTTGGSVYASPAVANGIVYIGSFDGNLYALNARTGALLWSYATGGGAFNSPPAVANGVVYIGSGKIHGRWSCILSGASRTVEGQGDSGKRVRSALQRWADCHHAASVNCAPLWKELHSDTSDLPP